MTGQASTGGHTRHAAWLPLVPVNSSGDAETGRGLLLVETISARWGWHFLPDKGGKVVWALTIVE